LIYKNYYCKILVMVEAIDEKAQGNPEPFKYITPLEPYNDTVLQYMVLEKMGYPVRLEEVDRKSLPEDLYAEDRVFQDWLKYYDKWTMPIVSNPEFEQWIESPDSPGDVIDVGEELDEFVFGHPMRLVSEVDKCDVNGLAYYLRKFDEEGEIPYIVPHDEGLVSRELIEKCLVAAFERNEQRWASDSEYPVDKYDVPDDDAVELYNQIKARGVVAVSPEELMTLIYDYYSLVERLVPEFASFKQVKPTEYSN